MPEPVQMTIFDFLDESETKQATPAEEYFHDTGKKTYWQDSEGKPYQWWKSKAALQDLEQKYPIPRLPKATLREEGWVDDWHYAELEDPECDDVYYGITLWGNSENYSYGYIAWVSGKGWYVWDSWKEVWKQNTHRKVLAWVQIPSLYRKVDKGLHKRLGLEGII